MTEASPWLTDEEQRVWRAWLTVNTELPAALHRQLQADSGLSLQDFEVLVHLTESAEGRVRVSALADWMRWERSRLSHHLTRMEKRGLVERLECLDDARGANVVLTAAGRAAIDRAAPGHACTVRRVVFDDLTADELATLASFTEKVLRRLRQPPVA